jgi:hypothetical protein
MIPTFSHSIDQMDEQHLIQLTFDYARFQDILESETVGGADENTDIYSVLPKLQSLLETSLLRFRNTTDSCDTQVLQLDTRKGCHVDCVGSLKDFMTTTFHILNSRLLLQKVRILVSKLNHNCTLKVLIS